MAPAESAHAGFQAGRYQTAARLQNARTGFLRAATIRNHYARNAGRRWKAVRESRPKGGVAESAGELGVPTPTPGYFWPGRRAMEAFHQAGTGRKSSHAIPSGRVTVVMQAGNACAAAVCEHSGSSYLDCW